MDYEGKFTMTQSNLYKDFKKQKIWQNYGILLLNVVVN